MTRDGGRDIIRSPPRPSTGKRHRLAVGRGERQAEVGQDLLYDPRLLDEGDDPHCNGTARTDQGIDLVDLLDEGRPGKRCGGGGHFTELPFSLQQDDRRPDGKLACRLKPAEYLPAQLLSGFPQKTLLFPTLLMEQNTPLLRFGRSGDLRPTALPSPFNHGRVKHLSAPDEVAERRPILQQSCLGRTAENEMLGRSAMRSDTVKKGYENCLLYTSPSPRD